jgi:hypothetical protein
VIPIADARPDPPRRPRHHWLYALPEGALPARVDCAGGRYELVETFKHDFFAATGLYRRCRAEAATDAAGGAELAVLKLNRLTPLFGLPMKWAGRFLARRELRLYQLCRDLPMVPRLIGPVGQTGLMHAFVPGHPLGRRETVGDAFFDELIGLVRALHARDVAYVDLNKRQNILMGDDGRPYLIDFQISLHLPPAGWRRLPPVRWLLARFQQGDVYHCLKHKRRLRPDLLTDAERSIAERAGVWIRLHRLVARPLTHLRRRLLRRLARAENVEVAGSSAK